MRTRFCAPVFTEDEAGEENEDEEGEEEEKEEDEETDETLTRTRFFVLVSAEEEEAAWFFLDDLTGVDSSSLALRARALAPTEASQALRVNSSVCSGRRRLYSADAHFKSCVKTIMACSSIPHAAAYLNRVWTVLTASFASCVSILVSGV